MVDRRLLMIVRGAENYGVATELASLARSFAARGWAVTVYLLGPGDFAERLAGVPGVILARDPQAPARFVAAGRGRLAAYLALLRGSGRFVARLRSFVRARRFDAAVFCEHGLVLPIAAALAGVRLPSFWLMPNIVSGGYPADLNRRLYAAAFRMSGMVPVANSRFTLGTLGRAGRRAETIDLGVDPALFPARVEEADPLAARVPTEAVRLVVIARLVREKGQLALLQAMAADPALAPLHLVLCGGPVDTPYAAELRAAAERAGAGERLHLIGPVDDPGRWHRAADVVASTRLDPEPFGLSIVEAMLSARPVLAHALGGPGDIVVDGATGWLLRDMTPGAVAAGLRRVLADRARWPAMGAAGRARALDRYTVDSMTDQLVAVFARHGVAAATP